MVIVPALVAVVALSLYLFGGRYVSTDNAYIGAQKVLITPEVSGKVVQHRRGRGPAARTRRRAVRDRSRALPLRGAGGRGEARARQDRLRQPQEHAPSLGKQIELSRQSVAAAQADFDRKTSLLDNRISSPSDLDRSRMALMAAKAQLEQLAQQEATARIQLLGDPELAIEKYPQFVEASVALDRARRDLANTVLRAPIAGIATQVTSIQMGRFLTAGMAVFSIIGTDTVWVDANPKETDLTYVRAGQPVDHHRRCLSRRARGSGTVAAISPGTGAQFAILPPQNAAGNWIKIVQRVPRAHRVRAGPGPAPAARRHERHGRDRHRPARPLARLLSSSAVAQDPDP